MKFRLTGFQQAGLGVTALLVALRLFFPLETLRGAVDVSATILQVLALLVLGAAVAFLGPAFAPALRRAGRAMLPFAVVGGWIAYLGGVVVAWAAGMRFASPVVKVVYYDPSVPGRYEFNFAIINVATLAAVGGLVLLVGLTILWKQQRRRGT